MQRVAVAGRACFASDKMQKVPLFDTERFFCDLYCLAPGQAQRVHSHADSDKVYYVLSGLASVQVGDESADAEAGTAVLAPAGQPHGVANRSDGPATLLVFMAPKPEHG
ncbi:MAG: cupin domain-containing protein [Zetaproteobacteria bacterium]|nr:MAG: cupin domain-containing protein [Zetaproteobacteria bacterium]